MKQIQNWLQKLGEALGQVESLLTGKRPALQPVPIRSRPNYPPHQRSSAFD